MTCFKYVPVLVALVLLSACGNEDEKTTPDVPVSTNTQPPAQMSPAPAAGTTATPTTANTALNPAHGLPGHRCDIAVGAPLNSPPGKTIQSAAPVQSAPVQAAPATDLTPTKGVINTGAAATGLNPAHGQPGHRCDIPVGTPLNSQPAKQ